MALLPYYGESAYCHRTKKRMAIDISVIKSKRGQSSMQFLDTATKLHIYTIKQCVKFPKRYTFYVSQSISDTATEILKCAKSGNSIYPTNAHEVQVRRDYFLRAYAETQSLVSLINDARELFDISGSTLTGWMELIQSELNLIKGVMKADKQRFKKLYAEIESDESDGTEELDA